MKTLIKPLTWIASVIILIFTSCSKGESPFIEGELLLTDRELVKVKHDNKFAFKAYKKLVTELNPNDNLFFSPLSISSVLAMTAYGARETTQSEMYKALELEEFTPQEINNYNKKLITNLPILERNTKLKLANSLWYNQNLTFLPDFIETSKENYFAKVSPIDITSPNTIELINNWISNQTEGLIPKMVKEIDPYLAMMLVNAIYFKGIWHTQFDKSKTTKENFTAADKQSVATSFMNLDAAFKINVNQDFNMVHVPYKNKKFEMVLLKPSQGKTMADLQNKLQDENVLTEAFAKSSEANVSLSMPIMKIKYKTNLNKTLEHLGMVQAFVPGIANFDGIIDSRKTCLSKVEHEAVIDVNEEGSEAAAVTVVEIVTLSANPGPMKIKFDQPFIFVIREVSSGLILFMGQYNKP